MLSAFLTHGCQIRILTLIHLCLNLHKLTPQDGRLGKRTIEPYDRVQPGGVYVYDLRFDLPASDEIVRPRVNPADEVENFELVSERRCIESMLRGELKPICALILVDFLIRHGRINHENVNGYTKICERMRSSLPLPGPM